MRRFQLIELHEQSWYPSAWRELFQLSLGRMVSLMKPYDVVIDELRGLLERTRPEAILDLCSGSGEVTLSVWDRVSFLLGDEGRPRLVLSDLYPNLARRDEIKERYGEVVDYFPEPVNVLDPPAEVPRVRLMIESLHHFRPTEVNAILRAAERNADAFIALENTERSWKNILLMILSFPMAIFTTAFLVRPMRLRNVIWGLLIPVVSLTAVFDGVVSCLRTYSAAELEVLARSAGSADFEWKSATVPVPGSPVRVTYLLGWRVGTRWAGDPRGRTGAVQENARW